MEERILPYTAYEIEAMYRNAMDKKKQIKILAELNGCTQNEIMEVLRNTGIKIPERGKREKEVSENEEDEWQKGEPRPSPEKELRMELPNSITMEIISSRLDGLEEEIRYHKQRIDNSIKIIAEREILYKQLSEIIMRGSI